MTGSKIIALANITECLAFFETSSLATARDGLKNLAASNLPDDMSFLAAT